MSPWLIYLYGQLDSVRACMGVISAISLVTFLITGITYMVEKEELLKPFIKPSLVICIVTFLIGVFTPSSKTFAMMIVIPEIMKSSVIQKDLPEVYNLAVEALKETIKK